MLCTESTVTFYDSSCPIMINVLVLTRNRVTEVRVHHVRNQSADRVVATMNFRPA